MEIFRWLVVVALLTPGMALATNVSGVINANTTWSLAGSPYNLTGDVTVAAGVTLTIEAGVQVSAATTDGLASGLDTTKVELTVQGTLLVQGTSGSPVTFTTPGANGAWHGIRVTAGSGTSIAHATITKAVYGATLGVTATVTDSTLSYCTLGGVYVTGGTATLTRLTFSSNPRLSVYSTGGVTHLSYSVLTGSTNTSEYAVRLLYSGTLDHNTLTNNAGGGVYISGNSPASVTLQNNIISSNGGYGVYKVATTTGTVAASYNNVWGNTAGNYYAVSPTAGALSANPLFVGGGIYRITSNSPCRMGDSIGGDMGALAYSGDATPSLQGTLFAHTTLSGANTVVGDLTVAPGVTLTVSPGATLTFATTDGMVSGLDSSRAELIVQGTLNAQGTSGSPITFTTSGANGAWYGIRVTAGTGTTLSYATVSKGVYGLALGTSATVMDSTISSCTTAGINVTGGTATLSRLTLSSNTRNGLYASGGISNLSDSVVTGSTIATEAAVSILAGATLSRNVIHGNSGSGVYINTFTTVTLDHNTLANNSQTGVVLATPSTNTSASVTLQNNIIASNGGYGLNRTGSSFSLSVNYNNVWGNSAGNYLNVGGDTGSISANPLFVGGGVYRITSNSPCRMSDSTGGDLGALAYSGDATPSLQGTLFAHTTLSGANTVVGDLTIPLGVTLTISPGATLTFSTTDGMVSGFDSSRAELIVQGTLNAQGASGSPITFTTSGANGAWYGIRVTSGFGTTLSYATISKGVYGLTLGTSATVMDSTISSCTTAGINVTGGTATLSRLTLSSNTRNGLYASGGISNLSDSVVTGSTIATEAAVSILAGATLSRNVIHGNSGNGVYVNTFTTVTLDHNTLANNSQTGVVLATPSTNTSASVTLRNNIIASNGGYGLNRTGSSFSLSTPYNNVWGNSAGNYLNVGGDTGSISANPLFVGGGVYRITSNSPCRMGDSTGGDLGALAYSGDATPSLQGTLFAHTTLSGANTIVGDLTVAPGVTLTVSPGATLTFSTTDGMVSGFDSSRAELIVQGTLNAQGASGSPITFTTSGANGAWYGIRVTSGFGTTLSYATVSKGVYGLTLGTSATVMDSTVSHCTQAGVYVNGGTATLSRLMLSSNTRMGVYATGGSTNLSYSVVTGCTAVADSAVVLLYNATLDHNTLTHNSGGGVYVAANNPALVTLQNNIITSNNGYGVYRVATSTGTVNPIYNDVWNNVPANYSGIGAGTGSFSADPLFVGGGDYRLQAGSPCRGAGSNGSDLGAYPYGS